MHFTNTDLVHAFMTFKFTLDFPFPYLSDPHSVEDASGVFALSAEASDFICVWLVDKLVQTMVESSRVLNMQPQTLQRCWYNVILKSAFIMKKD